MVVQSRGPRFAVVSGLAGLLLLSGCGGSEERDDKSAERDPAVTGALGDQIMVDPELAGQNEGDAGVSGQNAAAVDIPPEQRTPEAIAAARGEAERLVGGKIEPAPAAAPGGADQLAHRAATAAQAAAKAGATCADRVEYSARWAAALPAALAVYPRAAVQESAGTDSDGCRLRVVTFHTPVPAGEVVDFYYARLRKAGLAPEHRSEGADAVLGGGNAGQSYVIYVRKLANGLSEVDLVSGGQ